VSAGSVPFPIVPIKIIKEEFMKRFLLSAAVLLFVLSLSGIAAATNGDNLISIGPIARAMGGVGIAAPQDAISAVFANPAAMCFGPYCPGSEFNFAGSIFMPTAHTRITAPGLGINTGRQRSDSDIFIIPAIGISTPISTNLRFGLAAYGVSGLGVDYRDKFDLDPTTPGNQAVFTNLQIMKFAPNLAYMVTPNFSVGASVHVNYGALDLGDGTSSGYSLGAQVGALYKNGPISAGIVYVTPQKINHKNVANLDAAFLSPDLDDLKLESPQTAGVGLAFEAIPNVWLIEADVKWINWKDADGYGDFDWRDQYVFGIGTQYKPTPKLALRAGFNYGRNPVKKNPIADGVVNVQGKNVPRLNFEILRISGFPAVVESHVTAGFGYQIAKSVSLELGYTHAFKKSIEETGNITIPAPSAVTIKSDLKEDSIDFGITWRF
jgi:long-chain fatty acid transport protein